MPSGRYGGGEGGRHARGVLFRPAVLPTLLTLGNLFCGFLAAAKAADALALPAGAAADAERLALIEVAGWVIFLGMVFDALDGTVARLSGTTSPFGANLDSLADVVTFGVAPALLAKVIAETVGGMENHKLTLYFSVFFALTAAIRLARYNVEHGDPEEAHLWFKGLPTPGAAGVIAALAILLPDPEFPLERTLFRALPYLTLGLGLLMVSRLPFAHFTNRFLRGRKPLTYIVWILAALVLALAFHSFKMVLGAGLGLYALSGPVVGISRRIRRGRVPAGTGARP